MTLVIVAGIVGYLLGYITAKWRAILAALKAAMAAMKDRQAMRDLKAKMDAGADKDEEEAEDEDKTETELAHEALDEFLSKDAAPGLDDHPDSVINPLFMWQIRKAKEKVRKQRTLENLIKAQNYEEGYIEGLSDEQRRELEVQLLQDGGGVSGGVGSVAGKVRRWGGNVNSTRILVDQGASFAPGIKALADMMDASEKIALELREKWKQIDTFLSTEQDIDVSRHAKGGSTEPGQERRGNKKRAGDGRRLKDALTVAHETKYHPFHFTHQVMNFEERRDYAQRGRSRVAPPLDHAGQVNKKLQRRASCNSLKHGGVSGEGEYGGALMGSGQDDLETKLAEGAGSDLGV